MTMERATRRKGLRLAGCVLTFAVVAAAGWIVRPRERLLTNLAHPLIPFNVEAQQAVWVSPNQLLLLTTQPNGNFAQWQGTAEILNTSTMSRKNLAALTDLLKRQIVSPLSAPQGFDASPDGKWLRWETPPPKGTEVTESTVCLDGTNYSETSYDSANERSQEEEFFLDARHLVRMSGRSPIMVVRDLLDPSQDKTYTASEQAKPILAHYASREPVFASITDPAESVDNGYVEIETYRTQDRMQRIFANGLPTQSAPTPLMTRKQKLPEGATLLESKISRQQGIVYHLAVARMPSLFAWLNRLSPTFALKSTLTEELWVSRADASEMHEIGYVPVKLEAQGNAVGIGVPEYFLGDIRWLPDGKQISFVYGNSLYVMSAETGK